MPRTITPTRRCLTAASVAAVAVIAGVVAGPAPAGAATKLSAPVVRERFTALPCSGTPAKRTTLQQEGCAEQAVLRGDRQINAVNHEIFARLGSPGAKRDLISANSDWVGYRTAICAGASDRFRGGTEAPVISALCLARIDAQHVTDLRAVLPVAS